MSHHSDLTRWLAVPRYRLELAVDAARQMAAIAADSPLPEAAPLHTALQSAVHQLEAAHDLLRQFRANRAAPAEGPSLQALDRDVDALLGGLVRQLDAWRAGSGLLDHAADAQVEGLIRALVPEGLAAHVHLPFARQNAANLAVVRVLQDPIHRSALAHAAATPLADALVASVEAFDAAWSTAPPVAPTYEAVLAAHQSAHGHWLTAIVQVLATLTPDAGAVAELRAALLGPLHSAHEANRRRSAGGSTGSPAGADASTDPAEPQG